MRNSSYLARLHIPGSSQFLLFQTVKGSIDIVHEQIVQALDVFDGVDASSLSEAEIQALNVRGYLTEQPPEQEREYVRAVLGLLSKNIFSHTEVTFRFPRDAREGGTLSIGRNLIGEVFSLANGLTNGNGTIATRLEVLTNQVDAETIENILEMATRVDSPVVPQVSVAGLDGLKPWLKSVNFRYVLLYTDNSSESVNVEDVTSKTISLYNQQIHPTWRCNIDAMSSEQLQSVLAATQNVRQKYGSFRLCLISNDINEIADSDPLLINGHLIPYINVNNEVTLSTIFRFISTPRRINYNPFFQRDSEKLTFDVGTKQLTYQPAASSQIIEGANSIRAAIEESAVRAHENSHDDNSSASQQSSCKYALVCGCGRRSIDSANNEIEGCANAGAFEARLKQVLPVLLFNLQGNWRPPETGEAKGQSRC